MTHIPPEDADEQVDCESGTYRARVSLPDVDGDLVSKAHEVNCD